MSVKGVQVFSLADLIRLLILNRQKQASCPKILPAIISATTLDGRGK